MNGTIKSLSSCLLRLRAFRSNAPNQHKLEIVAAAETSPHPLSPSSYLHDWQASSHLINGQLASARRNRGEALVDASSIGEKHEEITMTHLYILAAATISLSALQAASNTKVPLRPTLPEPQATELQKLENSVGLKNTQQPAPVAESLLSKEDRDFLHNAAEINLAEIKSGMAAERSTDPAIKKLGERLVRSHQTAQKQLEKLATSKGITLPTELSPAMQEKIDALLKKSGAEFDKQFVRDEVRDHQEAIALFETEAKRTSDPEIKAWAEHMLSGLKTHLALAREAHPEPVAEPTNKKSKTKRGTR